MYPKIKFATKNWSDECNFYSKVIFLEFLSEKIFFIFFAEFKLLMFLNNIMKISENSTFMQPQHVFKFRTRKYQNLK